MKRIVAIVVLGTLALSMGCQKQNKELMEAIAKLEKRVDELEKKLQAPPVPRQPPKHTAAYDLPIDGSYVLGNPDAPVTMTVFTDFECPFCKKGHLGFVEEIFKDDELKNKVRVVYKNFPLSFHNYAKAATKASLAAGEQGVDCYWKMVDKLFSEQQNLSTGNYKAWAQSIKCIHKGATKPTPLDVNAFMTALKTKDAEMETSIQKDMKLGIEVAKIRGTPSFYVNGWELESRSVDALKQMIKNKNLLSPAVPTPTPTPVGG